MAMSIIAIERPTEYIFRVHLDTTKNLPDGLPDPAWVVEYRWSKTPPEGQTTTEYLANCKIEALRLAEFELTQRTVSLAGTPLTIP